jgi:recombination protein RecR
MDHIDELATALSRLPGIGPRQAKRFVFFLLSTPADERAKLAELISTLGKNVRQCSECLRFYNGTTIGIVCNYCSDKTRDDSLLILVEKDQDLD